MANRGYSDPDNHEDPSGGVHDTSQDRQTSPVARNWMTSVGQQVRQGGMTSDRPYADDGSEPPPSKYQGGSADGAHYNVAAERGTPNPTPGQTF